METQISAIEKFNSRISLVRYADKKGVIDEAKDFANTIIEEGADKLMALAVSSKLALFLKILDDELMNPALNDMDKWQGGKAEMIGMKLELAETGVKYDYSLNAKWNEITAEIDALNEKRKKMEAFIKTLETMKTEVDPVTGEMIEWVPAPKSSTTTIKRTIK